MSNNSYDRRCSIPISHGNMAKINPFNQKNSSRGVNNVSTKRKHNIPNSNREFGKEINISSNLTTSNTHEVTNNRRSLGIPVNKKIKKEMEIPNPSKRTRNFEQIALKKSRKEGCNSLNKKPISSNVKCCSNKNIRERQKKDCNRLKNKNNSQNNILNSNHIISINDDDIIMKDENSNPNILLKVHSNTRINKFNTINANSRINSVTNKVNNIINIDDDIEMKIIEVKAFSENKKITKENIQNVDEYFDDICNELFAYEDKYLVDPQYMSKQTDINHRMRAILIDWLIDVHLKYKLVPQTMYIAVNLIDRYLSKNDTNRAKLQLVGVAAMFIACKYEEIYPPELKDFVYITDGAYVKADVLNMEYRMLKCLDFNITFPTQWSIFEIYRKKLDLNEKTFKLAWFLMELCLINYKALRFKMSVLAASAILIASKTLGVYRNNWFSKNIGVEEKKLEECCKEIYDFYVYNSTHNLQAIRRKFSLPRFDEVAKIKLC